MTFGKIKTAIEKNLLESYKNDADFKKTLREFKHNILNDKSISKCYAIYDQLSEPQGLSEIDAKDFLQEGIDLLQRILPNIKLPKLLEESSNNNYKDIDTLVYNNKIDIKERINARKNIISKLTSNRTSLKENINIPVSSMVKIANQTLRNYLETMDESSKKEFLQIVSEDNRTLETKFEELKSKTISKLQTILEKENENEIKEKINETINKVKVEKFDQLSFLRLKTLESSI